MPDASGTYYAKNYADIIGLGQPDSYNHTSYILDRSSIYVYTYRLKYMTGNQQNEWNTKTPDPMAMQIKTLGAN